MQIGKEAGRKINLTGILRWRVPYLIFIVIVGVQTKCLTGNL